MPVRQCQLNAGDTVTLDYDNQFLPCEKKDTKFSYKKADGYLPGVATVGGMIVWVENRDGNANVRFRQAETLAREFDALERQSRVMVQNFRADCGSFSEDILKVVATHSERFYIRASNCQPRYTDFMEHTGWEEAVIGGQRCGVASFGFVNMLPELRLRLVVQRTLVDDGSKDKPQGLFGPMYIDRCIVTNNWENTERDIIIYYNKRGASERNFDYQNNDFGWAHLPFSFLKENTMFLIATAMVENFYIFLLDILSRRVKGLDSRARLKRFISVHEKFLTIIGVC